MEETELIAGNPDALAIYRLTSETADKVIYIILLNGGEEAEAFVSYNHKLFWRGKEVTPDMLFSFGNHIKQAYEHREK